MQKIYNGTAHAINVVEGSLFDPEIRKYVGGEVVLSIPKNNILNAKVETINPNIKVCGIPVYGKAYHGVDPLPQGYDVYIVSVVYAAAAKLAGADMSKVFTVSDPVYTEDGSTFIGCRGICPAF